MPQSAASHSSVLRTGKCLALKSSLAIFREMATSERPWEGSALCCGRGGGKTGRQMLFSGITSVCSPGLGFRSFARSGGWLLFVSFRDGAVARIFYLLLVRVSPRRRWSSGIRLVLLPGCSVLSPRFHFLFASTVIMNPFNVGQDPANRTAFGFWGTKSGFVWDYSWTVITVLSQLWAYHIFV